MLRKSLEIYSKMPVYDNKTVKAVACKGVIAIVLLAGSIFGGYLRGGYVQAGRNWNGALNIHVSDELKDTFELAYTDLKASSLVVYGIDYRIPLLKNQFAITEDKSGHTDRYAARDDRWLSWMRSECYTATSEDIHDNWKFEISCPIKSNISIPSGVISMRTRERLDKQQIVDIQDRLFDLGNYAVNK